MRSSSSSTPLHKGILTFKTAPDFEQPADADHDNVYVVPLRVTFANGTSSDLTVRVRVTDVPNALSGEEPAAPGADATGLAVPLGNDQLRAVATATAARWQQAGLSADQVAALAAASYRVADLAPGQLAVTSGGVVTLDRDGNGAGWYIDATPFSEDEFGSVR